MFDGGSSAVLEPRILEPVDGSESFVGGIDASVLDFWRWAFGDIRMNVIRGVLAEFLIAKAVGIDTAKGRIEWDTFDLKTPGDEVRIEVKSSAYLQSWPQRSLSKLVFTRLAAKPLVIDPSLGSAESGTRADVFVFAIQTCVDPQEYDPLNLDQWEFRVVRAEEIRRHGIRSVGLAWLNRNAPGRLRLEDLKVAVKAAAAPCSEED